MLIDNLLKRVQIECLLAFAHSRISGVAGKEQEGTVIFNNRYVLKDAVQRGKELEEAIKDLSTIEIINQKIGNKNNIGLANMYYHHYTKLLDLLDKAIPKDGQMIEGLIGLHILTLATEKGMLNDDNLEYFKDTIALYENDNFSKDEIVKANVLFMREISQKIFENYWKKTKKTVSKKKSNKFKVAKPDKNKTVKQLESEIKEIVAKCEKIDEILVGIEELEKQEREIA